MRTVLHPADGQLRRLLEEPLLVADRAKDHLAGCSRCTERSRLLAQELAQAEVLLEAAPGWAVDPAGAWRRLQPRLASRSGRSGPQGRRATLRLPRLTLRPATVLALAGVAVLATGTGTALAGVKWTEIFAPTKVEPVTVTPAELLALPHLKEFGQLSRPERLELVPEGSLQAAEAASGTTLTLPASPPAGVTGSPSFFLVPKISATFTFSAARLQAAAAAAGVILPALPAGFDGSQLRETVGPGVLAIYGLQGPPSQGLGEVLRGLGLGGSVSHASSTAKRPSDPSSGRRAGSPGAGSGSGTLPTLALVGLHSPVLDSTGVTVSQLESYMLSLPFLPPSLAQAIRQLGDPLNALPIPVLAGLGSPERTEVQGSPAVLFAQASPLLAAVVWEHGGTLRAIGGLVDEETVLQLARG
ncbi:MAG: hypothetical protein ACREN4_06360 [Candidatus Dormibacteria bacterium]